VASNDKVEISLIIPALNEAVWITSTLAIATRVLQALGKSFEIIIVDDGSSDETGRVVRVAQVWASHQITFLSHTHRLGKGAAIRTGMLTAKGALRFFTDADLAYPLEQLSLFVTALDTEAEIVIGRRVSLAPYQKLARRLTSLPFRTLVRALTNLPYADPQCGLKGFRADAAQTLFPHLRIKGYGFDTELLLLAQQHNYRIAEVPLRWTDRGNHQMFCTGDKSLNYRGYSKTNGENGCCLL
jgi:dolichyl-phosphate beta-glucosyltransferase